MNRMAERRAEEMHARRALFATEVQKRHDLAHQYETAPPLTRKALDIAARVARTNAIALQYALQACAELGLDWEFVDKRTERGTVCRSKEQTAARRLVMRRMREYGMSLPEIGSAFRCNHSSVIEAIGTGTKTPMAIRPLHVKMRGVA